jgi:putative phosphoesterase
MKIALISDIHSNLYYLKESLSLIEEEGVNEIYCLGDLVGYYDSPNEVIETCIRNNIKAINGNHEKYILGNISYNSAKESAYRIKNQIECLTRENISYLENLPDFMELTIMGKKLYLTHSLPNNCRDYIYDIRELDGHLLSKYDYYCFGHTHKPLINFHYGRCILNPGSIGQPRDYSKKPSYIVIDFSSESIRLVKVNVDCDNYVKGLQENGYDSSAVDILRRNYGNG